MRTQDDLRTIMVGVCNVWREMNEEELKERGMTREEQQDEINVFCTHDLINRLDYKILISSIKELVEYLDGRSDVGNDHLKDVKSALYDLGELRQ